MSQDLKRGAEEAFGADPHESKSKTASKRRKARRKQSTIANLDREATNLPSTSPEVLSLVSKKPASPREARGPPKQRGHENQVENATSRLGDENSGTQKRDRLINKSQRSAQKGTDKDFGKGVKSTKPEKRKGSKVSQQLQQRSEPSIVKLKSKATKHKQRVKNASKWEVSKPTGGIFIQHDPLLTPDEQFLILATKKDIQIYATKTSLLVRTIHAAGSSAIATYSQLPGSNQYIVVGLKDGTVKKFDWTTGKRIWTKLLDSGLVSITPTSSNDQGDNFLVVLELDDEQAVVKSLTVDSDGEQTGFRSMLTRKALTGKISFSADLGVAVVCTQHAILVGRLSDNGTEADLLWEEISLPGKVACFDAQISSPPKKGSKTKNTLAQPIVNIATGLTTGEIHIYSDILNKKSDSNELIPRNLHWHRAAPRTVKFSPDSNYLISGGDETVLVIWQLDTNQRQILPHLTSPILNATVSSRGSAYVLRLADNSVMALSTSDLRPFANVTGITIDTSATPFLPQLNIPAAMDPQHTDRVLLAYSSQSLTPGLKSSEKSVNMLQTFDAGSHLQLSRQALARNLASTINIGGNGRLIHEPDVTHLEISHDGKWLATVDQWCPDKSDMNQLYLSRGDNSYRGLHNESFLRFWSMTKPTDSALVGSWELNTRVDEPVDLELPCSTQPAVLAIAVSPVRHQVAVADTNNHLKIYSPKARVKGGLPVKDATGRQLFSWTCDHDLSLREASEFSNPRSSTLAFSEDGSVLAASWASTSHARARVYLIEPRSGAEIATLPDIVSSGRSSLTFCGQNLLALSSRFNVLNTVTMQHRTVFDIENDPESDRFDSSRSRLAVNVRSGVAAIALGEREVDKSGQILLFDVRSSPGDCPEAIHKERVSEGVQVLLAEQDRGGFFIVDGQGRTMRLAPPGSASLPPITKAESVATERNTGRSRLENTFGSGRKAAKEVAGTKDLMSRSQGGVALEDVLKFDTSRDVPGPMELFGRVAGIVGGARS